MLNLVLKQVLWQFFFFSSCKIWIRTIFFSFYCWDLEALEQIRTREEELVVSLQSTACRILPETGPDAPTEHFSCEPADSSGCLVSNQQKNCCFPFLWRCLEFIDGDKLEIIDPSLSSFFTFCGPDVHEVHQNQHFSRFSLDFSCLFSPIQSCMNECLILWLRAASNAGRIGHFN